MVMKKMKSSVMARADGRRVRRLTIYMPEDVFRRLSIYCAEKDRNYSEVVTELVEDCLAKKK